MYYDNPHARRVVEVTAQSWLHIPISLEMVKEEDLKHMTIGVPRYVTPVMRKSIKVQNSQKLNVLKHGKKHTAKLLAGYLKTITLP
jgi:hypothetical protein